MASAIAVTPLSPGVGAEVSGVDLGRALPDAAVAEIRQALLDHVVIFFRDQELTDEQHVALAGRFGPISVPAFRTAASERPEVMVLDQSDARGQGVDRWHSDNTFMEEPPMGSILRAIELPPVGGDTCFASMYDAFSSLSDRMQRLLDGLTAVHDITPLVAAAIRTGTSTANLAEMQAAWPPVTHPLVRTHPETGRKALYVNSNATVAIPELSEAESRSVLNLLFEHSRTPELQCRFHWEPHSIAFWDNRCAQHYAVADYQQRRIMKRVTIAGDRPV